MMDRTVVEELCRRAAFLQTRGDNRITAVAEVIEENGIPIDPDGASFLVASMDVVKRALSEVRAYNPIHPLRAGESPSLCPHCKEFQCVPGFPGCAGCVRKELDSLRQGRGSFWTEAKSGRE